MTLPDRSFHLIGLAWPALLGLCPGLHAGGQIYMTRAEALSRAFPAAHSFLERRHVLDKKEKALLEKKLQRKLGERGYLTWLALDAKGRPLGFVVLTAEVGRTEPFFLMLATDCRGKLLHLDVLEYREPRGSEVRHQAFLRRYEGMDRHNLIKRLRRVPVVPGATLSCHAVSRAVKKALVLHELYVGSGKDGDAAKRLVSAFRKAKTSLRRVEQKSPSPTPVEGDRKHTGMRSCMGIPAMGDVAFVELEAPASQSCIRRSLAIVKEVEEELSPRLEGSLVHRANALAAGESLDLSAWPLGARALAEAWKGSRDTGGRTRPVRGVLVPEDAFRFEGGGHRRRSTGLGDLGSGGFGKSFADDMLAGARGAAGLDWSLAGFRSSCVSKADEGRT